MIDITNKENINIKDKKVTILGLGLSGTSAAKLANHMGAIVFGSDLSMNEDVLSNSWELMNIHHIATETGINSDRIFDSDLWVVSPGISKNSELIINGQNRNIPIVGEIEFASWFTSSKIVAITGSNGKTTTSHILAKMCKTHKVNGRMAGNMGIPFSECVFNELLNPDKKTIYILEISSFQMEFIVHFCPHIALYTNITEDHLDRHGNMEEYFDMKMKMIQNIKPENYIVYNGKDPRLVSAFKNNEFYRNVYCFNSNDSLFKISNNLVINKTNGIEFKLSNFKLPGDHNISNFISAATCATLLDIESKHIINVFSTFKSIEHRLEYVNSINDVDYINDSKATNINSVIVAIKTYSKPMILILGGYNKGSDFRLLLPHIKSSCVRMIISYGEAGGHINTVLGDAVRSLQVKDLSSAVNQAQILAKPGEIVLFSPGCASFDQFKDFEERGDFFKSIIKVKKS